MTKRGIDDSDVVVQCSTSSSSSTAATTSNEMNSNQSTIPVQIEDRVDSKSNDKNSDYLRGNSNLNNNNNGLTTTDHISIHQNHNNNNNKKFKSSIDSSSAKSRVVHIRNIPTETNSQELIMLASPFGHVTNHLFVRSKCQAFVEFESPFSATQMANYWIQTTIGGIPSSVQPTIRGRHVHVQVSNHKELKTHDQQQPNNNGLQLYTNGTIVDGYTAAAAAAAIDHQQYVDDISHTPSTVLRIVIENQIYPITLDTIYQLFSRLGVKVLRIILFHKNQLLHALIQFNDLAAAILAKTTYDGQSCYPSSSANFHVMRIEYSKLQNLIVNTNNDKCHDYTTTTAATTTTIATNGNGYSLKNGSASTINGSATQATAAASSTNHHLTDRNDIVAGLFNYNGAAAAAALAAANNFNPLNPLTGSLTSASNGGHRHVNHNAAAAAAAASILMNQPNAYLGPHTYPTPLQLLANCGGGGGGGCGQPSLATLNPTTTAAAMFAAGIPAAAANLAFTPVVHVSGLNPEHITPDALFTLFGVYGDVIRVKILFNKKDTALIQMAEPNQAQNAISYLDRTRLFGKTIHLMSSKHQMVQMPKEGHQDSGLTKDYANSPLHRFKRPGSKNYNNIYPPSETLHVSNIPSTCSEDDLRQFFQNETGKQIQKFKFFPNDHRMALIQFESIEDAVLALIKMHNYKVAEHSHLRVSFSKSPV